jgi:hypothetical protein
LSAVLSSLPPSFVVPLFLPPSCPPCILIPTFQHFLFFEL